MSIISNIIFTIIVQVFISSHLDHCNSFPTDVSAKRPYPLFILHNIIR